MPEIEINPQGNAVDDSIIIQQENGNTITQDNVDDMQTDNSNARTYSDEEINNPAVIDVTIADTQTPIVVLFGPPQSGKTMTMVRLAEYLTHPDRGYTVAPDRAFRKAFDETYRINCDNFNGMLNSIWAAEKSKGLEFMQLVVSKNGSPIVQILEAPGEHYYDPVDKDEPKGSFLPYITKVIQSPNRKIWVYLTEPNWKDHGDRMKYAQKVQLMKRSISRRDKSIVLFNKVDATNLFFSTGEVNRKEAERFVNSQYPGLFRCFKNENPITSLWRRYNCVFVPFVTGSYNKVLVGGKNTQRYVAGPDNYPKVLWDNILKIVKG
ncbi:MAG: hypothetical protein IJU19_05325 [Bacteroidales bacterium]|nr:hypothetical protein [Bacteroidales bacterium]